MNEKLLARAKKLYQELPEVGFLGDKHKANFIARARYLATQLDPTSGENTHAILYLDHIATRLGINEKNDYRWATNGESK